MSNKSTFSGFFQVILGVGILAAGGTLFYQKLKYGGPEKLSLKYTCESFRAIKEAQTVAQEQSLKLEKMLNLQLLQSRAAIENRRSFRESAAAVCELHTLYAAEQLAELSRAEAELRKLKALKKFCTGTCFFPGYITAFKDTASAVEPLQKSLAAAANLSSYKGMGESVFHRIGSSFEDLHASVSNMHTALSKAGVTLEIFRKVTAAELFPALENSIAVLEKEIKFRKSAAAAARKRAEAINRICASEDLQNNISQLSTAIQELDHYLKNAGVKNASAPGKKTNSAQLERTVTQLQKAIAEAEKNKAAFQSRYPGHSAASYDRVLSDLQEKLAAVRKNIAEMGLARNAQDAISKASRRLATIAELKRSMTLVLVCEMLLWFFVGTGFIANGLKSSREEKALP